MMFSFPLFIKWNITDRCNLRCKHCFKSDYNKEFDLSKVRKIVSYFANKNLAAILLTGGEPLVRNDFLEIVEKIAEANIPCSMVTNGTLITEHIAGKLVEFKIRNFQVSLENFNKYGHDKIRGKGSFEDALNGIKILKKTKQT